MTTEHGAPTQGKPLTCLSRRELLRTTGLVAAGGFFGLRGTARATSIVPANVILPKYFPLSTSPDEVSLGGKLAVVTGASRGIGRATAEALLASGVNVIGTSRYPHRVSTPFPLFRLDITRRGSVRAFARELQRHPLFLNRGHLDILINNAGRVVFGTMVPPVDLPGFRPSRYLDRVQLGMETLYTGHVRVTTTLLPLMLASDDARILFTTSIVAYMVGGLDPGSGSNHTYTSAKRALLAYANNLRAYLRGPAFPGNVKVSTVNPYAISTAIAEHPNPIYTEPVNADGLSDTNPAFNQFLLQSRAFLANGLPPSLVGEAFKQLLTMSEPEPNVVAASTTDLRGGNPLIEAVVLLEQADAAVQYGCQV